ncbi:MULTISPECIES: class I lanthipeptide [Flavobacteriaceae]|uniref:class I lanthipeptide n=1 Tax=Flavobacteriaceae TaxID=49546 RepID=UPI0039E9D499
MLKKKLSLNKEKIASLNDFEMNQIRGGVEADKSSPSTKRGFTCCWCIKIGGSGTSRVETANPTVINN